MSTDKDFVNYLAAVRALQSDDPKVRRPAISMLLELARQGPGAVPAHAERALTEEFGPYAVSDGLSGCSAPIEAVNACDGNCRSCVWLWEDWPVLSLQRSSPIVPDLDLVGETHRALALPGSRFGQCWASAVQWCNRLRDYLRWAKAPRKRLEVVASRHVRSFRMPRLSKIQAPGGTQKDRPAGGRHRLGRDFATSQVMRGWIKIEFRASRPQNGCKHAVRHCQVGVPVWVMAAWRAW